MINRAWGWLKVARKGNVNTTLSNKRKYGRDGAGVSTYINEYSPSGNSPALWLACGIDLDAQGVEDFKNDMRANGGNDSDFVIHLIADFPNFQDSVATMGMKPVVER